MDSTEPFQDLSSIEERVLNLLRTAMVADKDLQTYAHILLGSDDVIFILHADKLNIGTPRIQGVETESIIVDELYEMEFGRFDNIRVIQSNLEDIAATNSVKLSLQKAPKKSMPYYYGRRRF